MSELLEWRKSRRSASQDNCIEVAPLSDGDYAVRDSKDTDGPILRFSVQEWRRFTARLKG